MQRKIRRIGKKKRKNAMPRKKKLREERKGERRKQGEKEGLRKLLRETERRKTLKFSEGYL